MTAGRAAMLTLLGMYRALNYTLSQIEVQKLAYFLQATGEEMNLDFQPHKYGPYSGQIRPVLNRMEGHFIRGVGDGVVESEIEPIDSALEEAQRFIQSAGSRDLTERVKRVADLIEGFQTPYGMELLSTVHWVATHDPKARSPSDALEAIRKWSDRKRDLMDADHVQVAWDRLREGSWLETVAD